MLQKKKLTTPTTRFASVVNIFDSYRYTHKLFFKKKKIKQKRLKIFSKTIRVNPHVSFGLNIAGVIKEFLYNKKPYQCFFLINSLYNNKLIVPGTEHLVPGKKVFDLTKNIIFKKVFFLGSYIYLNELPYNLFVNCVANNLNTKWTYGKASGTFLTKLKAKKTVKLIFMELPSSKTYLFLKNTPCYIGKNTNFFNNKFIEGKWGFSLHNNKIIAVRGVAMNPVDHPNGGRTKAKQPEKSPWGWIAKKNK